MDGSLLLSPLPEEERVAERTSVREAGRGSTENQRSALSRPPSAGTLSRKRERGRKECQLSSAIPFRNVPIPGTAISTTSPGSSQRGGSKRAPAPTGVPVTMMSPGFNVVKIVM